jgi:hypothetical protein
MTYATGRAARRAERCGGKSSTRNVITMSNREIGASQAPRMRVADLNERMRAPGLPRAN